MQITPHISTLIDLALSEDVGSGDLTTMALFDENTAGSAELNAHQPLVICGLDLVRTIFQRLDPNFRLDSNLADGAGVDAGSSLAGLTGSMQALLTGERTALNFIRHLSGIATLTRRFVEILDGTGCRLLDPRKTTPGFRVLEKYAVRCGGGSNHRMGLFDGVMLKDNHIAAAGSIQAAVKTVRAIIPPTVQVDVECADLNMVEEALQANADIIMLDNMDLDLMRQAVQLVGHRARTEASGRLDLQTIRPAAETGVDYVSVGALTHSAPAADIGMDLLDP